MAVINNTAYTQAAYQSAYSYDTNAKKETTKAKESAAEAAGKTTDTTGNDKKVEVKGPGTYGNPKLSEKALDYYNSLKKRYGKLNFVLVASDRKQEAEMMKGSFANANALTVLIDTDKIERMATDEAYRAKYEAILNNAASGMNQFKAQLGSKASSVRAFGMTVNDGGTTSFFAVVDKSLAAQRDRIEKKREEKAEAKKKDEKKAEKAKKEEKLEESRKADDDTVTITANSVDELIRKIDAYYQQELFGSVRTKEEEAIGQRYDFSI